jgi:MFS superfamily sulfate permease-like transporter
MNLGIGDYKLHEELREKARAIANFKMHRTIFILANVLIWLVSALLYFAFQLTWWWAFFPTAIWLVILTFHYLWVFRWNKDRVEKEYIKLLKEIEKKKAIQQDSAIAPESKETETNTTDTLQ